MGDIVGSVYESPSRAIKRKTFPLFGRECTPTDDSILTIATADALLGKRDYAVKYRAYYRRYPGAGYGSGFVDWAAVDDAPARPSWGNGAAMRVSPIGFYFEDAIRNAVSLGGDSDTQAAIYAANKAPSVDVGNTEAGS